MDNWNDQDAKKKTGVKAKGNAKGGKGKGKGADKALARQGTLSDMQVGGASLCIKKSTSRIMQRDLSAIIVTNTIFRKKHH